MCEQTEINYLDGDVVWVKLGGCWWPGQVTGFHNLPEDIQSQFKKKPLIAVVKFFQEDTYEFVKNYQQIYKYNCTLKDEFIKKGLDKYRTKSKDGSRYMDKFPGDVEMAEKLTGGDPDILNQDRFCPEEKPDISALFGERKIAKKKKDRDDMQRRSDSMDLGKKITHPRFLKESDHEVRIRQQPSSLPSTPSSTGSPVYPCHLCTFTSSRVNVIICHIKSHRSGNSSESRSKVKSFSQYRPRTSDTETPKRKYVKKEKIYKSKGESGIESGKRKQPKQTEKSTKKRKTDPKIRDTILADWDDESDEDANLNQSKSIDGTSLNTLPTKAESDLEIQEELNKKNNTISDGNEIISETEKLLKETEKLTSLQIMDDSLSDMSPSKSFKASILEKSLDLDKDAKSFDPTTADESSNSIQKEKEVSLSDNEGKQLSPDKEDKKALLSCFDFHEEEPSIPPVRKKGRAFHQKKEIIKEFEMSQALKTEQEKELGNDKSNVSKVEGQTAVKPKNQEPIDDVKMKEDVKSLMEVGQEPFTKSDTTSTKQDDPQDNTETKLDNEITQEKKSEKSTTSTLETRVEIVEIVEVEKKEENNKIGKSVEKKIDEKSEDSTTKTEDAAPLKDKEPTPVEKTETQLESKSILDDKQSPIKDAEMETAKEETVEQPPTKDADETLSERFTTETEDETVSESAETIPEQSENSDAEILDLDQPPNKKVLNILRSSQQMNAVPKIIKKRRGRPRKNVELVSTPPSSSVHPEVAKLRESRTSGRYLEKLETERTSESDTERSYTGRRRKPNKKYLESDIYVQDVDQRTFKTDESLSESDDKSSERSRTRSKGKAKRGQKSSNLEKRKTETAETIAEKELEVTHHMLDASDNVSVGSKFSIKNDVQESDESLDKSHVERDDAFADNQSHPSTKEMLQDLISESMSPNNASLTSVTQAAKSEKGIIAPKSADPVPELPIIEEKPIRIETKEEILQQEVDTRSSDAGNASDGVPVKPPADKGESEQPSDLPKTTVEMLPPKKSQIKKFELSQIDFLEGDTVINKTVVESDDIAGGADKPKEANSADMLRLNVVDDKDNILESKLDSILNKSDPIINMEEVPKAMFTEEKTVPPVEEKVSQQVEEVISGTTVSEQVETEQEATVVETDKTEKETPTEEQAIKKLFMQTRYKGKFIPETGAKGKKEKEVQEQTSVNTFQEAFLKTLQMDKKKGAAEDADGVTPTKGKKGKKSLKRKLEEAEPTVVTETKLEVALDQKVATEPPSNIQIEDNNAPIPDISNFETIEVVVDQNIEIDTKVQDSGVQNVERVAPSAEVSVTKSLAQSPATEDSSKSISLDMQKIDESSRMSMSTPSPSSDTTIPVKKREMPRIIENVTLTEPMQILKSKLLDKMPQKGAKHKLDSETSKKGEPKGSPRAKVMKIESLPSNSKMKTGPKVTSPQLSLTKKLQVLKAEEAETAAAMASQTEKLNVKATQSATTTAGEKYIQQSSQSLTDMELDINSMPFVLSEDVLTPENIDQMPVVISSIIPASGTVSATLSLTPTTQIISTTPTQLKTPETSGETSPTKKKSGTPAILKSKNKAKPTITSIKTIVPPLTGGVKGIKFQNTQAVKTAPLLSQKPAPGKYVVVQASGGQQLRYSVQGKPGLQQKIAIPTGKGTANAQVVQQGGKVVILTSAQSGQTKMLPLNISKTLTGKVQRIMTSKGQVLCPINPQGIITSKTIIAPKGDGVSPTTSKLTQGHKILNTQGIITSKGVLTPISGTIAKTALLGTLSQGILTKGGIYTPISASALSGKTIIGSKTLVTKGATILSSPNLGTSKAILTPISQAIGGKTILSSPAVVSTKGTVLTPITGQQVKAIAAKSPSKGGKAQYQSVQHKVQLPVLQKTQKVPGSSTQGRSGQGKSATSTLVLQNTSPNQKNVLQGKKVIKQTVVQQSAAMQNVSARTSGQQTVSVISQMQQKGKGMPVSTVQKVVVPRGGRQTKAQQKIMVQKVQEPTISTVQSLQTKSSVPAQSGSVTAVSKTPIQYQKHGGSTPTKASAKAQAASKTMAQKNLLNMAMNTAVTTVTPSISATLSLPPLEPIEPEKKLKSENVIVEAIQKERGKVEHLNAEKAVEPEKVEEPKIPAQPQIMALPTESSDGTQTYVLVTIDEQGQIQPLDNNTLMSLEGTTQNPDGTRTLYIDPSSLGDAGTIDNIVLQFDNGVLPNVQAGSSESKAPVISESFPTSEVVQTSNQDILAAALANTDFQQEISLPETEPSTGMPTGLTQTSLINQTILQSTIIPPTEPISSPSVLETSLTLNQPIMTPLEVPTSLPIQSEVTPPSISTIPSSLELPITITNPNISYISSGETQIQLPGNSMPDIGEIMENSGTTEVARTQNSSGTQYLVIPNLEESMNVATRSVESGAITISTASYSVSIPNSIVLEGAQVQTTPSMPIIDDTYTENIPFSTSIAQPIVTEQSFVDTPVSEMLVAKVSTSAEAGQSPTPTVPVISEIASSHNVPVSSQETTVSTHESTTLHDQDSKTPRQEVYSSQEVPVTSEELILQQTMGKGKDCTSPNSIAAVKGEEVRTGNSSVTSVQTTERTSESSDKSAASSMPIIDETSLGPCDANVKSSTVEHMSFEVTDSSGLETDASRDSRVEEKLKQLGFTEKSESKLHSSEARDQQAETSSEVDVLQESRQVLPAESLNQLDEEKIFSGTETITHSEDCQKDEPTSQGESNSVERTMDDLHFEEANAETSHESPSQSYNQFGTSVTSDSADLPSQSAAKSESLREPTQSYEPMETDEEAVAAEPPTQSFEDSRMNEASQSYEVSEEANTNTPTQSFNELIQNQEERSIIDEAIDDQTFPTQSYEVNKPENIPENLETDAELSQEGNIPSQSNDIGADGIGTSSVSTNNSGLNEDETASSSYVPETPENQERDQDQESAISTSSYEIPPCEELNIGSSSVIPDTSVRAEHTSIHDNGVPEIPTSSYNLNPDISSTHVDSVPTSSYEDQVIVEQNVSTSYEVPISMPGLEETCSQNFVTESTDHRNEPSSYYTHHQEVTASYYESVDQETNSRLEEDPQEEVTPSYYESNPQEASQSYFNPEEASQSYSSHNVSPSYYDPRPESEASQSYYSTDDIDKTEQSPSQNIEASQSFYQEQSDELKLQQQGEATPTYTERYPVDYTLENSPIERHDLVESSVPAPRPTER